MRAVHDEDLREPRPIYVVWELTLACDQKCRHCGSRAGTPRRGELSTDECLGVVNQLAAMGTREISLIGGEAYLRPDWLDLVGAIRKAGIRCSLTTGGLGVDEGMAKQMASAGLQQVGVSIDGLARTHDRLRGVPGSHAAALAAVDAIRNAGMTVTANTQVGAINLPELNALCDLLVAGGVRAWQVQLTAAIGRAASHPELLLQPYQMLTLMPQLASLKQRAANAGMWLQPANNVGYFGPYEEVLRATPFGDAFHWVGCLAGQASLGLEADGTVKGCPSLQTDAYAGGNVRDTPIDRLWKNAPAIGFTRQRSVDDLWGFCARCYYADVCLGGCSYTAHGLFGRPGNNPYCHHRALTLAEQGQRERVVPVEAPPGRPFDSGRFELVLEPIPQDRSGS